MTSTDGTRKQTYNLGFDLNIIPKKLVFTANSSLYHYDYQYESFNKAYHQQNQSAPNTTREAKAQITRFTQILLSGTLNYHDTFFENHNVDAMIGGEYFDYQYFNFNASTENSPFDTIHTLNVGANRTATKQ